MLRQYFPKGTDLSWHTSDALDAVAHAVNTRPRKTWAGRRPLKPATDCSQTFISRVLRRPVDPALRPAVAVVDEAPAMMDGSPVMQRLLQRIEDKADMRCPADAPANDIAGIRT